MLEARNLSFSYGAQPVLRDVSLQIAPGGITVLIGPSGTGKTTLLRCLALLEPAQSGVIAVDDLTYTYPTAKGAASLPPPWPKLTAVFQQLFMWPHLTLRQNIMLPVQKRSGDHKAYLAELVEAFGMQPFIDRYPNEASLGQRQRAALARALMLKPRYLLLDEITSALDVEQIAHILSYLKNLRGKDMGIFIITHLLGFARHAADQVYFMADGTIAESGGPDLLRNPQTERLGQFLSVIAEAS